MTAYKKVFEIVGDYYSVRTKMSSVCARIAAYGPLARGLNFLPARAVHAAVKGVTGPELAPGEAAPYADDAMDFAYIKDTAEALAGLQLAPVLNHSIYNIGGGKSLSNREVADAVQKAVPGAKIELQPGRSSQPQYPALDISRLKEDIGWTPRYTIDSGIAEYVAWLKAGNPQ